MKIHLYFKQPFIAKDLVVGRLNQLANAEKALEVYHGGSVLMSVYDNKCLFIYKYYGKYHHEDDIRYVFKRIPNSNGLYNEVSYNEKLSMDDINNLMFNYKFHDEHAYLVNIEGEIIIISLFNIDIVAAGIIDEPLTLEDIEKL